MEENEEEIEFDVDVEWSMITTVKVMAKSLDEAIEKVANDDGPLPDDGEYLENSWSVNEESTREIN